MPAVVPQLRTITLGGAGTGPQAGGLTAIGARAVQTTAPAPKPEAVRAPAATAPAMTIPLAKTPPAKAAKAPPKTDAAAQTPDARGTTLARGDEIGLRGPLGSAWPVERAVGRDVVIVTGGIGLAPLRPLIDAILAQRLRFGTVRIYYGARTPRDLLFTDELERWAAREDLEVGITVDRAGAESDWTGPVGIVTHLFDRATWDGSRAVAFVCGPERMMEATAQVLGERGLKADRIFVTLERHMECGIGLCGHCQMGRYFVCKDGPVFSLAQLTDVFGREGI